MFFLSLPLAIVKSWPHILTSPKQKQLTFRADIYESTRSPAKDPGPLLEYCRWLERAASPF